MPLYRADANPQFFRVSVKPDGLLVLDTGFEFVPPIVLLTKETKPSTEKTDDLCDWADVCATAQCEVPRH